MDSMVLSVVRCADFYSLWTKCGLLGRPVSVVSWDLFCLQLILTKSSKSPAGLRKAISNGWGLACIMRSASSS